MTVATAPDPAELDRRVREWIARDGNEADRAELRELLACRDCDDATACERATVDLEQRFSGFLTFGTAGLRGPLRAGPNGMNSSTVAHATVGIANYLHGNLANVMATPRTVIVGFDGRRRSHEFARDIAQVLAGSSIRALLFDDAIATPVLSFAVSHLNADAGIMVTASHNPRDDNGMKVYLGGSHAGRQLVAPDDAAIHRYMVNSATETPARKIPRGREEALDESVVEAYVALTAALVPEPIHQPRTVYTALHGVGSPLFHRVVASAGFDPTVMLVPVVGQDAPDESFPTLEFPNPEEDGALDLARALATKEKAELILAHDPDADRLGVAIPADESRNRFVRLSGNDVGVILGLWVAERAQKSGVTTGAFACSVVSTPQLQRIAREYGFDFEWTLPGFKWISRVPKLLFGFEEALGYLVNPTTVHDKDGLSAGLAVLSVASDLHAEGRTLRDLRDDIDSRFGTFVSGALSVRSTPATIERLMSNVRESPPRSLANIELERVDDFAHGGALPPADILALWLADGSRVMLRPSGTESKLKIYIDVCEESAPRTQRATIARERLAGLTRAMRDFF